MTTKFEHFFNRLKLLSNSKTDAELARKLGISRSSIANWKSRKSVDYSLIFSKFEHIDFNFLIKGQNSKPYKLKEDSESIVNEYNTQYSSKTPLIHLESVAKSTGDILSIDNSDIIGKYEVPYLSSMDFMTIVPGSSMQPNYNNGDLVGCKLISKDSFIQWNRTHVVSTKLQGVFIKRLIESDNSDTYLAVSDNPTYPPFSIPKKEILNLSLVIGAIRVE